MRVPNTMWRPPASPVRTGRPCRRRPFTLYHEKYINVTEIKDLNAVTGVGMYPDALLPFGVAEAYGETRLTGKNQGVWVSLKVPDTQPAGVYTGTFRVTAGGKSTVCRCA